jgi:hypothetical protein
MALSIQSILFCTNSDNSSGNTVVLKEEGVDDADCYVFEGYLLGIALGNFDGKAGSVDLVFEADELHAFFHVRRRLCVGAR